MKESGPQPINRVIRQREDQIAPEAIGSLSEEEFLGLAASLERGSEHPLAQAIVNGAEAKGVHL